MQIKHPISNKYQKGVALVVALFIVALVTAMSYYMLSRLTRDTRRLELIMHDVQADLYAEGSVLWAKETLRVNLENKKPDHLVDVLPIDSPENIENNYHIKSTITDVQGRFNINSLDKDEMLTRFIRLVRTALPKVSVSDIFEITGTIADWVSPGKRSQDMMQYYLGLPTPYRPAHRPMISISELRLVKGITPELYNSLLPFVTALPPGVMLNIQTAPAEVITSLNVTLTLDNGRSIVATRQKNPFTSTNVFTSLPLIVNNQVKANNITVESSYFLVETVVTIEKQRLVLYTLLERVQKNNKPVVNIVWQSKGSS